MHQLVRRLLGESAEPHAPRCRHPDCLEPDSETPRIYQQEGTSSVRSMFADHSLAVPTRSRMMIHPAHLATLVARYRDKQSADGPAGLPTRPSPARTDR